MDHNDYLVLKYLEYKYKLQVQFIPIYDEY